MKIVIASDHAAYESKTKLIEYIKDRFEVIDVGPYSEDRCNYPDYAIKLVKGVIENDTKGLLLCGSGIGVSIVANRYKGIRAALCRTVEEAKLSRQHNDANVLCLGGRINTQEEIKAMVDAWLETDFEEGRHSDRIAIFNELGESI